MTAELELNNDADLPLYRKRICFIILDIELNVKAVSFAVNKRDPAGAQMVQTGSVCRRGAVCLLAGLVRSELLVCFVCFANGVFLPPVAFLHGA